MPQGYLALLVSVLASVGIVFLGRLSGRRGSDPAAMLLVAVLAAGVGMGAIALIWNGPDGLRPYLGATHLTLVSITALCGATGTVLYFRALTTGPAGPVSTIASLQMLVPVVASVLWWAEPMSPLQAAGVVMGLAAIVLINSSSKPVSATETAGRGAWIWRIEAVAAMLLMGLTGITYKYKQEHLGEMPDTLFLSLYWLLCAAALAIYQLARRQGVAAGAWRYGVPMGGLLMAANMTLPALRALSVTVVYLIANGGPPVIVVLLSMIVLGERYPLRVRFAVGMGLVAVVLMVV